MHAFIIIKIRKRRVEIGAKYAQIVKHIKSLHSSKSLIEFKSKYQLIDAKWVKWRLGEFATYFRKQWVASVFSNWMLFSTPPGYATTNNPLESYNALIKAFFTNRSKLNIVDMLNTFKQVIQYESSKLCNYDFVKIKLVDEKHIKKAKRLMLSKFSNISNNSEIRYKYTHECGKIRFIDMANKDC